MEEVEGKKVKVMVSALYYERGKRGNDVTYRESYKVPVKKDVSSVTMKSFMEYLR